MTADQRLDQVEPILAQALATLDQHTAQNERHTAQLKVIIGAITQQSDNIEFLLREQAEMKSEVAGVKSEVAGLKNRLAGIENKLDQILGLLGSQNR